MLGRDLSLLGCVYVNADDFGSGNGSAVIQEKHQAHVALDHAGLQKTILIN
jgi:hypothetical protein